LPKAAQLGRGKPRYRSFFTTSEHYTTLQLPTHTLLMLGGEALQCITRKENLPMSTWITPELKGMWNCQNEANVGAHACHGHMRAAVCSLPFNGPPLCPHLLFCPHWCPASQPQHCPFLPLSPVGLNLPTTSSR
jgi:hypothetical protein